MPTAIKGLAGLIFFDDQTIHICLLPRLKMRTSRTKLVVGLWNSVSIWYINQLRYELSLRLLETSNVLLIGSAIISEERTWCVAEVWGPNLQLPHSPPHPKPRFLVDDDDDDNFVRYRMRKCSGKGPASKYPLRDSAYPRRDNTYPRRDSAYPSPADIRCGRGSGH